MVVRKTLASTMLALTVALAGCTVMGAEPTHGVLT